jgi:hypothetical protein
MARLVCVHKVNIALNATDVTPQFGSDFRAVNYEASLCVRLSQAWRLVHLYLKCFTSEWRRSNALGREFGIALSHTGST